MPLDVLSRAFGIGLNKPPANFTEENYHNMVCATLICFTKFLNKIGNHRHAWRLESELSKFLCKLGRTILDEGVMKLSNKTACDNAIKLLIKVVVIQQKALKTENRRTAKESWVKLLKGGLNTQLHAVSTDAMEMKIASKSVKAFFETFDRL